MNHALAALPESAFYFHLAAVALLLLSFFSGRAILQVLATREGRRERAQRLARVAIGRLAALGAIWTAIVYGHGAWERAGAHNCRHLPAVDAAVPYAAEYCYLRHDRLLLRVYGEGRGDGRREGREHVLAHRTITSVGPIHVSWDGQALVYASPAAGTQGRLALPPTWRDRLLARLP
ncbi:hypothetical protein [Cupriavidus sp. L7L]|uniref:hypothetical protein n=1 Tax=Cupriavidus sp. L7L TaxID=2546443 RepID=UPI0010551ADA|nr:hypothetical protein [Cupriavidus sp. L7L]TDF66940.1 hypothetical protein E1J61_06590 [Cupriavidus sp. L7L]